MHALHSETSTLLVDEQRAIPAILYFGPRLHQADEACIIPLLQPALPQAMLDTRPSIGLASSYADGSFLNPAIKLHQAGQHWAPQWHVTVEQASEQHLMLALSDRKTGLIVHWHVKVARTSDVWTFDVTLSNQGTVSLELAQWLTTLPLTQHYDQVTSFSGRWVKEFQPQQQPVPLGTLQFTNTRGRTSHDHFPGLLLSQGQPSTDSGQLIACHLGWSGNHQQQVERSQNGLQQYQAGIALMPGEIILAPGERFLAAPLYVTHTERGLAGVSANFQRFVREDILTLPTTKPRPVHINTWEALYFDHKQTDLDALADAASDIGAERFVLDDGWFAGRRNDQAGLGDWVVDQTIYPHGLTPLAATLKKHKLGFGLWLEPEMVNHASQLYQQHPDWVLQLADQKQPSGRNQWVLDISRRTVQEHLFAQISRLLDEYPIEYIKWDMNRDLLQAGDAQGKPVYYRYVHSLYALLDRLRAHYPKVEIESCSSGGGRMDYGILKRTHRFWLSDCNDAKERQNMQQWASLFFPAEVLGSHIGPPQSHTTSRVHALAVRAGTALFGHMGIEWDIRKADKAQRAQLAHYIALYKQHRKLIHSQVRWPLKSHEPHQIAFAIGNEGEQLVSVFQSEMPTVTPPGNLSLTGLDEHSNYTVQLLIEPEHTGHLMKDKPDWMQTTEFITRGELLQKIGLPLPVMDPETLLIFKLIKH